MDPLVLSLFVAKVLLINARNLILAVNTARENDGVITRDELPEIVFNTAIKSLDDLGAGEVSKMLALGK